MNISKLCRNRNESRRVLVESFQLISPLTSWKSFDFGLTDGNIIPCWFRALFSLPVKVDYLLSSCLYLNLIGYSLLKFIILLTGKKMSKNFYMYSKLNIKWNYQKSFESFLNFISRSISRSISTLNDQKWLQLY